MGQLGFGRGKARRSVEFTIADGLYVMASRYCINKSCAELGSRRERYSLGLIASTPSGWGRGRLFANDLDRDYHITPAITSPENVLEYCKISVVYWNRTLITVPDTRPAARGLVATITILDE